MCCVYRNTKLAVVEAKAWDEALTEGVGQAKTTRTSWRSGLPMPATARVSYGIRMRPGERACARLSHADELWNRTFAKAERLAAIVFAAGAVPGQERLVATFASIRRSRVERVLEKIAAGKDRILPDPGHGHRPRRRLPFRSRGSCSRRGGTGRRADAPAAHPVPGRSNNLADQAVNDFTFVQRLQRGRLRAGRISEEDPPEEGKRAQERQPCSSPSLPDLHRADRPDAKTGGKSLA